MCVYRPVNKCHAHYYVVVTIPLLLQSVARGGVSVEVTLEYVVKLKMGLCVCIYCSGGISLSLHSCLEVYDSWPNNRIEVYPWYQLRRIKYCVGKLPWGATYVSDPLSNMFPNSL